MINSKENYKTKAKNFSIHCFVHEKIKFYTNNSEMIDKNECKKMKTYIDKMINENTPFLYEVVKEYMNLLNKNDLLNIITLKPDDLYFKALSDKGKDKINIDDYDILIDSY